MKIAGVQFDHLSIVNAALIIITIKRRHIILKFLLKNNYRRNLTFQLISELTPESGDLTFRFQLSKKASNDETIL